MAQALIGRARERRALEAALHSPEAELVAVYGRRRVGKTFLVRELYGDRILFELTGLHGVSLELQLRAFAEALEGASSRGPRVPPPADWIEAFRRLRELLERSPRRGGKRVVFLDELPWLASRRSGFLPAFEHFWNSWAVRQPKLVVVVCGSASAWMVQRLLHSRGGLHNRVTRHLRLAPFTLAEAEAYLLSRRIDLGRHATVELYAALGGIPHYLRQVERGESMPQAIDRLCFDADAPLRDEFGKLYASLFEHHERHEHVVRTLAQKRCGMTRNELIAAARRSSGGTMTQLLEDLEESGFVMRTRQFGLDTKDAIYRLIDEYSLFYLAWIERHRGSSRDAWLARRGGPAWRAWSGYAFEGICLKHVPALKRALGIEAVETMEAGWHHRPTDASDRGAQIDLLIDRKDACINLCEMKFADAPFVVDKRYAADLRRKRDTFRGVTATRKALLVTMVTNFGVRDNAHARELVDKHVELPALFAQPG